MIAGVVRTPIARASSNDLMTMAVGEDAASMQVGVVLMLDRRLDTAAVRRALAERVRAVPRLRQRLVSTPWGCGRPVWVDDADFDIDNHVRARRCAPPGDESALLDVAAAAVTDPLPKHRALWSGRLVTDLADDRCAFVLVVHHVLADGIGGLAALAQLADGAPAGVDAGFPMPPPSRLDLCADAARSRLAPFERFRPARGWCVTPSRNCGSVRGRRRLDARSTSRPARTANLRSAARTSLR